MASAPSTPSALSAMHTTTPITVIVSSLRDHTIAFPLAPSEPLTSIYTTLYERAPWVRNARYILTTTARRHVPATSDPLSSLLPADSISDTFLPLRLTVPLCGGKGGFGSILRAQGGRMSKKKSGEQHGSSRNLDGRRLRTVAEAKALAEYLAIKPDMEKKEKEERMKRWEDIVASSERKQEEIRSGKGVRMDGKWVEEKEEAESKTREAVEAMLAGMRESGELGAEAGEAVMEAMMESEEREAGKAVGESSKPVKTATPASAPVVVFGWDDEDDEFMSDSEEEEEVSEEDVKVEYEGKGKGKSA